MTFGRRTGWFQTWWEQTQPGPWHFVAEDNELERVRSAVGPSRRARVSSRVGRALAATALLIGVVSIADRASAVHDTGSFQLDGDAQSLTNPMTPPAVDDWDKVCHEVNPTACPTGSDTTGATAVSWTDDGSLNATIFTGGGSKDPIDVDQWAWKDGSGGLPDKDNLLHSFAARYSLANDPIGGATACPAGTATTCEVLYFGSDRYDNSGDAQQGFWFFQNKITLGQTKLGGGFNFDGVHKNGDLLVISDFSNGGTVSTISVYQWDNTVSGNLKLLASSEEAKCTSGGNAGDSFCGIVNPPEGNQTVPWSFTDKSGSSTYLNGEFYEGGINLSALGLANLCFSSLASETRSSTSTTATLKDLVLGQMGQCGSDVTTTPKDGTGGAIPSGGLLLGSGGTVTATDSADLVVSGIQTWSGTLSFAICGPIDPAAAVQTCPSPSGTPVPNSKPVNQSTPMPVLSDPVTLTAVGKYCWRADFTPSAESLAAGVPAASDSRSTECFNVTAVPTTISTNQFVFPQDSAKVSATSGGSLAGSVKFRLYDSLANCSAATPSDTVGAGGLLYIETVQVSGASPQTKKTNNTTVKVDASTAGVYWLVEYASTNQSQLPSSSVCTESTAVTFTGDDTAITIP